MIENLYIVYIYIVCRHTLFANVFFCLVLSLFLSYPFLVLAHFPDFFFPKPPFSERCFSLFSFFFKSGVETPDRNCQWYQHLLILLAIFFNESNMFMCFTLITCACFVLYSTSVRFDLVKISEVTLGYKPSIYKSIYKCWANPLSVSVYRLLLRFKTT